MEKKDVSMKSAYEWVAFYESFATELLDYKNKRKELIEKLQNVYKSIDKDFPLMGSNGIVIDIDPFTVFALFNRQNQSDETRSSILSGINSEFGINKTVPLSFYGVPQLDNRNLAFFDKNEEKVINDLWEIFKTAIQYADPDSYSFVLRNELESLLDSVSKGVFNNITMGLYWICPNKYFGLNSKSCKYLVTESIISPEVSRETDKLSKITGKQYLHLCDEIAIKMKSTQNIFHNFLDLSHAAYNADKDNSNDVLEEKKMEPNKITDISKNTILYGPPGTGKTYQTVVYAVAIIENRPLQEVLDQDYTTVLGLYNKYKEDGRIEFTTFHQSYGYEEFIEGIRPVMPDEGEDNEKDKIQYEKAPGMFKAFCEKADISVLKEYDIGLNDAPTIWKVSLEGTGDNDTRKECMENGHIRIGFDSYRKDITSDTDFNKGGRNVLNAFIYKMKRGDVVLSCYSATTIDAIGVVTGEYEWHDKYDNYKRLRKVNWIVKGIKEDITKINGGKTLTLSTVYELSRINISDVEDIITSNLFSSPTKAKGRKDNYVFIIDEINRGNISKIFGELITLIEPSKRKGQPEGMEVKLPYSQKKFGVPDNVYIIATMNTADRSIATLDTALRRRFNFKEIMPNTNVLKDKEGKDIEVVGDDGHTNINIVKMLDKINKRITVLYDREHTIGHAYFMPLQNSPTIETLSKIFSDSIIPLLQEYFYEDYEKIRLVLGDNQKKDDQKKDIEDAQFVIATPNNYETLFGNDFDSEKTYTYKINKNTDKDAFKNAKAYKSIYEPSCLSQGKVNEP